VSIQLSHDLDNGTMELTQGDHWVKAVERFQEFLGEAGPKKRNVPLSPLDKKMLGEPSEAEIKAAEHLPYPNLLGVVQYPSNFTKVEMKYAMSILSRSRAKWGVSHFKILLKCLEYGYSTRKLGILYQSDENEEDRNKLVAYADASFNTPRSQGCRLVMMNGAAISYTCSDMYIKLKYIYGRIRCIERYIVSNNYIPGVPMCWYSGRDVTH
jgi:hypothetical protein